MNGSMTKPNENKYCRKEKYPNPNLKVKVVDLPLGGG
jgi:hypothetical protein